MSTHEVWEEEFVTVTAWNVSEWIGWTCGSHESGLGLLRVETVNEKIFITLHMMTNDKQHHWDLHNIHNNDNEQAEHSMAGND